MRKSDFNNENYTKITSLIHIQCFKVYLKEKYPMPSKPPKELAMVAFENGMPVLYLRKDIYPEYMDWCSEEKIKDIKTIETKRINDAIEEEMGHFEQNMHEIDKISETITDDDDINDKEIPNE